MDGLDRLLWSIALPGFGQFLNKQYVKGIVLLFLEFLVNIHAKLNVIIISSFQGLTQLSVEQTNYQWLMFYPCLYMYAIWDAYHQVRNSSYLTAIPYALAAYLATVGIIYSSTLSINGYLLGPVWLPMIGCFVGLSVGYLLMRIIVVWRGKPG